MCRVYPKVNLTDTDSSDPGEDPIGPESADTMDADTFEVLLTEGSARSAATIQNHHAGDESVTTGVLEGPEAVDTADADMGGSEDPAANADTSPTVVIDHFLLGSAGAPIPGIPQGPLAHGSNQAADAESLWAPFNSECDWKFACWAKTRGPTSSAVTDLLAVEEVRHAYQVDYCH